MRIELTTSSLPRKCSTPELQQLNQDGSITTKVNDPSDVRAGDEARTRYLQLGRLSLYQMSYSRKLLNKIKDYTPLH
jgi:hypothetical protein